MGLVVDLKKFILGVLNGIGANLIANQPFTIKWNSWNTGSPDGQSQHITNDQHLRKFIHSTKWVISGNDCAINLNETNNSTNVLLLRFPMKAC